MTLVHQGDLLACDMEKYGINNERTRLECDIKGNTEDGSWVDKKNVSVSSLDIEGQYTPGNIKTGQRARQSDRDIEIALDGATCSFGMSGPGGILKCFD